MVELSDNTDLTIPLRNLVSIVLGVAVVTAGYADLNSRITTLEHGQSIQDMTIRENAAFVREWPLGLRGALPDDLIQNAKIIALEDRQAELQRLQERMNEIQIDINRVSGVNETHDEKLSTLFDIWNKQVVNK
jgi:uncharacterized coiled-coil protein SlyX